MKTRPILFSAPMVRALLDGSKTQTRRVVKPQPAGEIQRGEPGVNQWIDSKYWERKNQKENRGIGTRGFPCPYGQPGDRLWVRETFIQGYPYNATTDRLMQWDTNGKELPMKTWYRADKDDIGWSNDDGDQVATPWKPSIHMPRTASRITLEITGVRVERLQDISEADAIAEGLEKPGRVGIDGRKFWRDYRLSGYGSSCLTTAGDSYKTLWESINAKRAPWASNPWVWVIEFKRLPA